jgi:hypothetical protein
MMRFEEGVIPSRADDEGPPSWKFRHTNQDRPKLTMNTWHNAVAFQRSRGPSARFASLGMTRLLLCHSN